MSPLVLKNASGLCARIVVREFGIDAANPRSELHDKAEKVPRTRFIVLRISERGRHPTDNPVHEGTSLCCVRKKV